MAKTFRQTDRQQQLRHKQAGKLSMRKLKVKGRISGSDWGEFRRVSGFLDDFL